MYSGHTDWVAKAYLTRAECLSKLQQPAKARETLEEMMANKDLERTEEYVQARDILRRMKGDSL